MSVLPLQTSEDLLPSKQNRHGLVGEDIRDRVRENIGDRRNRELRKVSALRRVRCRSRRSRRHSLESALREEGMSREGVHLESAGGEERLPSADERAACDVHVVPRADTLARTEPTISATSARS